MLCFTSFTCLSFIFQATFQAAYTTKATLSVHVLPQSSSAKQPTSAPETNTATTVALSDGNSNPTSTPATQRSMPSSSSSVKRPAETDTVTQPLSKRRKLAYKQTRMDSFLNKDTKATYDITLDQINKALAYQYFVAEANDMDACSYPSPYVGQLKHSMWSFLEQLIPDYKHPSIETLWDIYKKDKAEEQERRRSVNKLSM